MRTWYTEAARRLAEGTLDWATDSIACKIVSSTYTFSAAHTDVSVEVSGELTPAADSGAIAGLAVADVANGSQFTVPQITISGVASGQTPDAVIFYRTTDNLPILYIDEDSGGTQINLGASWPTDGNNIQIPAGPVADLLRS